MTGFSLFRRNFKKFLIKVWVVSTDSFGSIWVQSPDFSGPSGIQRLWIGQIIREPMVTDVVDFIVMLLRGLMHFI